MNDIDKLGQMDDVETGAGGDDYQPPSEFPRPPEPGTYTFMRVEDDPEVDYKHGRFETKDGVVAAWFNFRAQIQGGPSDGRTTFGGCNTLASQFRIGSSADDFIRSAGSSQRPRTIKQYEDAIPRIYGPFNATTSWEWRCKSCEVTFLKGYKSPKKPRKYDNLTYKPPKWTGEPQHVVKCPECSAEVGANLVVINFVVPKSGVATVKSNLATAPSSLPPAAG